MQIPHINFIDSLLNISIVFRRKPTRGVSQNDQGLLSDEGSVAFDDDTDHRSSRSILISVRHSPSLTRTDPSSDSNPQSMINDIPPAIPPRKPLNKKSDIQIVGRLSAVKSTKSDDISLSNPQPLLNKEVRRDPPTTQSEINPLQFCLNN